MTELHGVDLNLWVVFAELLDTGSVTAAARRLHRTQSAVSHSLASLRTVFRDPLFVRVGARFEPTPRAKQLQDAVRATVDAARRSLSESGAFDPAQQRRVFRLFLSDYAQVVLLPRLLALVSEQAPHVTLDVGFRADAMAETLTEVAAGRLDLVVAPLVDGPAGVVRQTLFSDHNVCVLRRGHPALKRFTVERFAALPHVLVSPRGLGRDFVDEALAKKKLQRRVVARVPHFVTAPHLVVSSDAVALVPQRIAQAWGKSAPVQFVDPPLPLPSFAMAQYFSTLYQRSPEHVWLRRLLEQAARGESR